MENEKLNFLNIFFSQNGQNGFCPNNRKTKLHIFTGLELGSYNNLVKHNTTIFKITPPLRTVHCTVYSLFLGGWGCLQAVSKAAVSHYLILANVWRT